MRRFVFLTALCALAVGPGVALARHQVLVELFTAQGCASCTKANALVGSLSEGGGVVALTWPVDYWDYLGWKDTFARPEFTERQRQYERRLQLRDVYTPQVIIDGAAQVSGDKPDGLRALIRKAARSSRFAPDMRFLTQARLAVGSGQRPKDGADVWLIRFDSRERDVPVKAGDNRGAVVPHKNTVKQLVRLGRWRGAPVVFKLPVAEEDGLTALAVVQAVHGGAIIGLLREPPPADSR